MSNQIKLQLQSSDELTNFLKRFSGISGSLLIEMEDGVLKAKTHTPERSVVKSSKIDLARIFGNECETPETPVLFGVASLDRVMKSFSHFGESAIDFAISTESTPEGVVGTEIVMKNDSLDINHPCASLRLFTHITDEMMDRIADNSTAQTSFVLTKELQARINSLTTIDSDQKLLTLTVKNGIVKASGKSFNLNILNIDDKDANLSISVYKSQFAYLDKEDTMVYMNEDRLIFHSIETDTKMIIGKAD
jgi:hypothetical protein